MSHSKPGGSFPCFWGVGYPFPEIVAQDGIWLDKKVRRANYGRVSAEREIIKI